MPVSTAEWMPSDSMAELPVSAAATNFVTAIRELPTRAAMMTFLEDPDMALGVGFSEYCGILTDRREAAWTAQRSTG